MLVTPQIAGRRVEKPAGLAGIEARPDVRVLQRGSLDLVHATPVARDRRELVLSTPRA